MAIGAIYLGSGQTRFRLWAPQKKSINLHILSPREKRISMKPDQKQKKGYWLSEVADVYPGSRYYYQIDGKEELPDPASYFQPEGVTGPSEVIDHTFSWHDQNWQGIPLSQMVIYELHTGTFSPEGEFASIIPRLESLLDTGINTLELMPVAQFSGSRNWGYDGVFPFAVQNSYGRPDELKKLVDACHQHNMAIVLDVVYNHLGPEANVLPQFAPYLSQSHLCGWGQGINFDGPYSDEVRNYFIQNALYWLEKYHFDGLRLDAIHAIFDMRPTHFLAELSWAVRMLEQKTKRKYQLIAESDLNDNKVVKSRRQGGYGIDAQWNDDFHHSLHALVAGEKSAYYQDFGKIHDLAKAIKEGFVYSGQYSPFRKRSHGTDSKEIPSEKLIVCSQNHDQIANHLKGERISNLTSWEGLKLAAAITILSPYVPLLFMGEEYGEETPFTYFISHQDSDLIEAVREGRKKECAAFGWEGECLDPQNKEIFEKCKIHWQKRKQGHHKVLLDFYRRLLQLRKKYPLLQCLDRKQIRVWALEEKKILVQKRIGPDTQFLLLANFDQKEHFYEAVKPHRPSCMSGWQLILDSSGQMWLAEGSRAPDIFYEENQISLKPFQFLLYQTKGANQKNGKE